MIRTPLHRASISAMARKPEISGAKRRVEGALILAACLLLGAGCKAQEVPDEPTWAEHVKPILAANCVRCHGYPAINGAPDSFRLDRYDDFVTDDGRTIYGAARLGPLIHRRTDPDQYQHLKPFSIDPMPPPGPIALTTEQRRILQNWGNDVDGQQLRGTLPGNQPPSLALSRPLVDSLDGDQLVIQYELRDPDGEAVSGELRAGDNAVDGVRVGTLHSGRGEVVWDVGAVPEGTYGLFALVDDGSGSHELDLGTYEVNHGGGNTAPLVTILGPNRDSILRVDSTESVRVRITDPDVIDVFTWTVEAFAPGETPIMLAVDAVPVPDPLDPTVFVLDWDTTAIAVRQDWQLRVTVTDGTASRTRTTGKFIVTNVTTSFDITNPDDTIANLISEVCTNCHGSNPIYPDIDACIPPAGLVYRRIVQQRNMPPESFRLFDEQTDRDPQLTPIQREQFGEWVLAGRPGCVTP